ncbi:hypothetical protein [Kitasatospora sp. NPDC001175]
MPAAIHDSTWGGVHDSAWNLTDTGGIVIDDSIWTLHDATWG